MTNTGQIGFIGGMRLPTTLTKYAAYLAAAQKVNPLKASKRAAKGH